MPMLIVQYKVKDYEAWRPAFDEDEADRVKASITNARVFRKAEDPNDLILLFKIGETAKAKTWLTGPNLKKAMQTAGLTAPPKFNFVP